MSDGLLVVLCAVAVVVGPILATVVIWRGNWTAEKNYDQPRPMHRPDHWWPW